MKRPSKSQWDFGELFPAERPRPALTVSELTTQVKRLLENEVGRIWVTGEITNLRVQGSGHVYFTLKDSSSQVNCVFFRGEAAAGRELLQDGQKVLLQGDVTASMNLAGNIKSSSAPLNCREFGALQIAFEKLKQKLNAEGLFATDRKRRLPVFPARIGLVTSPTGAALRDVLHVIGRRDRGLQIVLAPCRVQGAGAGAEIAQAIARLNDWSATGPARDRELGLILLTRGGGSLEDLWAFNEETVARAIFHSSLPVVSAVGHEIDFTISDFVADLRAATPSAAAEIITEGVFGSREFVAGSVLRMAQDLRRHLGLQSRRLTTLNERIARSHPRTLLEERLQRMDDLQDTLRRVIRRRQRDSQAAWRTAWQRFRRIRPAQTLARQKQHVDELGRLLTVHRRQGMKLQQDRLTALTARLRLLSPEGVLERGYSMTTVADTGRLLRDARDVSRGARLVTRVRRGEIRSVVEPGGSG